MPKFTMLMVCICQHCSLLIQGLGATLVLLAVFHIALPALPISLLCSVLYFVCIRIMVLPYVQNLENLPIFV
jgi:presenilin 1